MQLYSVDRNSSQQLSGHAGTFASIKVDGRADLVQVLAFEDVKPEGPRLQVIEVRAAGVDAAVPPFKPAPVNFPMAADAAGDFPLIFQVSKRGDILFAFTKMGYVFLFDIVSCKAIYRTKLDTVMVACPHESTGGVLGVTARKGQLLHIAINDAAIIPFVVATLRDTQLAISLAGRCNLPGAEDLYNAEFTRQLGAGDIAGAARTVADSPNKMLRTPQTMLRFQQMPAPPTGGPNPIVMYFQVRFYLHISCQPSNSSLPT